MRVRRISSSPLGPIRPLTNFWRFRATRMALAPYIKIAVLFGSGLASATNASRGFSFMFWPLLKDYVTPDLQELPSACLARHVLLPLLPAPFQ